MKKSIQFVLLFVSFVAFSQTTRFIYDFKYKTDSTATSYQSESMILELNNDEIQFYEQKAIRIDSLNALNNNGSSSYTFEFAKIKRKLSTSTNKNYYFLRGDYWVYESNDKIEWKIENETKKIGDWTAQRATTNFGGRKWIAWFVASLPISEGPHKFNGLPGLVVELYDTKDNFIYKLLKIEKPKTTNTNIVETVFKKNPVSIPYKKFREMQIDNYNDPYYQFRSMREGTWAINVGGQKVTTHEGLNKVTRDLQAYLRKNNNPIELDKIISYK
ncbi:GLPGLI family protein [Riemerella anatipestifer]|nr:GLPGLI family protein [Riemerella anatipestifer]